MSENIQTSEAIQQTETPIETNQEVTKQDDTIQTPVVEERQTTFEVDGKNYNVNENMLRKFYGIEGNEPFTDREWKVMVSSYKSHTNGNLKSHSASNIQKQASEAFKMITENPEQALSQLFNGNPKRLREFAENYLLAQIEEESIPEEQKTIRSQQKKIEEYEKLVKEQEQIKKDAEMNALTDHFQKDISEKIITALDNNKTLPKNPETIQKIAHYMLKGLERGIDSIEPKDVIPLVLEDYQNQIKSLFGSSDIESLTKFLGDDQMKKIRQFDISKVKKLDNGTSKQLSTNQEPSKKQNEKNMTTSEYNKFMKERLASLNLL